MPATRIIERPDHRADQTDREAELRAHAHGMWAAVAGGWEQHADNIDTRVAQVTEKMLELTKPKPGERVLELACGPGGLGLEAAQRVGSAGAVVLSDVNAEMTSIAAARADALGLRNVSTRELDLEQIEQPDASYDVVLCREGLMFAPDPARAAREIGRVLRPGGRVALSVWGPRECNPWLGVVFGAVRSQLGKPGLPPGIPGVFALADSEELARLLSEAELTDVSIGELPVPLHAPSFEDWWARTTALAAPLAQLLVSLPADATQTLRARVQEATSAYRTPAGGLEFPGLTLLATARRAGA